MSSCRCEVLVFLFIALSSFVSFNEAQTCRPISIKLCKDYVQSAVFPNLFDHRKEDEAGLELNSFDPLIKIKCSSYLKQFLCIKYFSPCQGPNNVTIIPPCREICEHAKSGCRPVLKQYGFDWPKRLNCNELPNRGDPNRSCFWRKEETTTQLPRNSSASMPTTTRTTSYPISTPEPTCSAFQEKLVMNGMVQLIYSFNVPKACHRKVRERLLTGGSSGDVQRRLERIDRMLVGMDKTLRRLTLERKAALVVANIRRALRNL